MSLSVIISNSIGKPIYEQITEQIKQAIRTGAIAAGDPLPSVRGMAKDLRISIIMTKRAYEDLECDGFIDTYQGKGRFVRSVSNNILIEESLKEMEGYLLKACELGRASGVTKEEMLSMISELFQGIWANA